MVSNATDLLEREEVPVGTAHGNGQEAAGHVSQPEEPEEIHLPGPSFSPIIVAIGSLMALLGIIQPLLAVPGVLITFFGVWRMAHFPEIDLHSLWLNQINSRKLAMWIFLGTEIMFFSALAGAFMGFKIEATEAFIHAEEELNLALATVGTSVLIISSFAVVMGLEAIQSNDRRVFRNWMGIALLLGASFVAIQAFEWRELYSHDITSETLFGSSFYLATGFHGLHVIGGVVWLGLVLLRARRGVYGADNYMGVEMFGLYWHFVDVVWIVLFTLIYLIPIR